ncbi:MAG TPA: nitrophenyl compound nitroreductase subunit ArsF family protein [Candidatus Sulfomarinibacteraceae bacterium]|nr:nitrophenyl compound nitroreductase subunit ArsF family protein [Candidatus Sulfomarinibacteraceae bacterium]
MRRRSFPASPVVVGGLLLALATVWPAVAADDAASPAAGAVTDGVVAFYFHGNVRCATCRTIEAYAHDAIHAGFAGELDDGALSWRVVNVDEPENKHFVQDFQLVTRSVVLAELRDGKVVRFTNLDKVWQLVRNRDDFVDYIQNETREFLGER